MVLPAASCPADVPTDYCCDTLPDIADRIRTVAFNGVTLCQDPTCADREFRSYTTIGQRVQDPLGDAVIVSMTSVAPSARSSARGGGPLLNAAIYEARFDVRVVDNGWPTIRVDESTNTIIAPDPDMINVLAKHSMAHGEKMWRTLVDAIQTRTLFTLPANDHIGDVAVSQLVPIQPETYQVGWICTLTVQAEFR